MIHRTLETHLLQWKDSRNRRPLLIRGARQVGKSTLVREWAKGRFEHVAEVDLEQRRAIRAVFTGLDPKKITETISLMTGVPILPGKTLLFLDEIQEEPAAITALRYFFEQMPGLHVIGAGSLLEMKLRSEVLSLPVGRVEFLHLFPLSFQEFLGALGEMGLQDYLQNLDPNNTNDTIDPAIHQKLLDLVKAYCLIGGMPAVVEEYAATRNTVRCRELQNSILMTYRNDFGKYASLAQRRYLEIVFDRVPGQVGRKLLYSALEPEARSANLKTAVEILTLVGVLHRIQRTIGSGLPLEAGVKAHYDKILFLDVGLMQRQLGLEAEIAGSGALLDVYRGAVAEQFAGQELLISFLAQDPTGPARLYYWSREAKNSKAELDYLLPVQDKVLPIEVKAGSRGTLKSLWLFLKTYGSPLGLRISQHPLSWEKPLLSIPLYLASETVRLAGACLGIRR